MNATFDNLSKQDNKKFQLESILREKQDKMQDIFDSLCKLPGEEYEPAETVRLIQEHMKNGERILYSELSDLIFSSDDNTESNVMTNIDKLVEYASERKDSTMLDAYKITVKLWDHIHLAIRQEAAIIEMLADATQKTSQRLTKEFTEEIERHGKAMEKEYITILGIFASIVLTFVGGIAFSTSVLENINSISFWRLILVIDFLGYILISIINLLVKYIFNLNRTKQVNFHMGLVSLACAAIGAISILGGIVDTLGYHLMM